ncbi:F0F1 ATP synthase subunit delta [Helicobacter brantae]|uniref:Uncharacterized protein n=1 Tax=Helicobacter brantae TaxID=375927 RepID=A0A3D8J0V2_9HELI|nr:F0F1 ATP synthase subunit delta [Helicobacter brantae]RDU71169.1 hypothetical protein CQA58_03380 [Helicobacter brantae]
MKSSLAQRYSQAFIQAFDAQGAQEFVAKAEMIDVLFANKDFLDLVCNPFVDYSKKYEVLNGILAFKDEKIQKALLLLAKSGRLSLLPEILSDVLSFKSLESKTYKAIVYCNSKLSAEMIEKISKILCQKLDLAVSVEERLWERDGIKCVIDELDLEVSFSKEMFVSNLQNYILDSFRKGV